MKAVVHDRYGPPDVLHLEDVPKPEPQPDEVLIKVHATTVNRTDTGFRAAKPFFTRFFTGLTRPKTRILGTEVAGEVAAAGAAVSQFKVGDHVFGVNPWRFSTHAEFVCMRESAPLAHKPSNMPFEEAAAVCDGFVLALSALRPLEPSQSSLKPADLKKGDRILIYGASGSIGTAAVQLARHVGAHVTAVCATKNLELVRALGADEVIDYTREDFTKNGQTYDIIFDAVGKHSFRKSKTSLKPGGEYVATDDLLNVFRAMWTARFGNRKVLFPIPPRYRKKEVLYLKQLIEAGNYRAVIDRTYPLEQVVEATRYVETQQKTGNVVLTVA